MTAMFMCKDCGQTFDHQATGNCPNCTRLTARSEARAVTRPTLLSLMIGISLIGAVVAGAMLVVVLLLVRVAEWAVPAAVPTIAFGILSALLSRGLFKNRDWTRGLLMTWVAFPAVSSTAVALLGGVAPVLFVLPVAGVPTLAIMGFFAWYFSRDNVTAYYSLLKRASDEVDSAAV